MAAVAVAVARHIVDQLEGDNHPVGEGIGFAEIGIGLVEEGIDLAGANDRKRGQLLIYVRPKKYQTTRTNIVRWWWISLTWVG